MSEIWNGVRNLIISSLEFFHGLLEPVFGDAAWGWAIIALTVAVRILLIPLAVKQFRSMRSMQELQPKIKAIQKKYKVDRDLLRKDPELYKSKKQKMGEEMTALYQEAGVHPAGGCLPLLMQAPLFLALFRVLDSNPPLGETLDNLLHANFYFFTPGTCAPSSEIACGLQSNVVETGWAGWLLIVLMSASMFFTQKQMMSRNKADADPAQLQQQRIMMIVMPIFLGFISLNLPVGVLLYWVTTNIWQVGQQSFIIHEVKISTKGVTRGSNGSNGSNGAQNSDTGKKKGSTSTSKGTATTGKQSPDAAKRKPKADSSRPSGSGKSAKKSSHLPSRRTDRR